MNMIDTDPQYDTEQFYTKVDSYISSQAPTIREQSDISISRLSCNARKKKRLNSNVSNVRASKDPEKWFGKPSSMFYDRSAVESLELKKTYNNNNKSIRISKNKRLIDEKDKLGSVYISKKKNNLVTPGAFKR